MDPLRILAIDPAMANLGWILLDFEPDKLHYGVSPQPDWITTKDAAGTHTYHCFTRLAGGVFETDKSIPTNARLISQVDSVHMLVDLHKPDLLAYETQLEASGGRRGFSGGAQVAFGIIFPYFDICERPVRLFRCPGYGYETDRTAVPFSMLGHIPLYVVGFHPSQINSVSHYTNVIRDKTVVDRYRQLTGEIHRTTAHEADAYFIGVHAGRFWAVGLEGCWGTEILTGKEKELFLNPRKGMLARKYTCWWNNF